MSRDRLTRTEAVRRIVAQMPLEEKVERADIVIQNDGSLDDLRSQVEVAAAVLRRSLA